MATIVTIQPTDLITNSRADLNTNFANLNSDKVETSVIDTDTTLAADSDDKIPSQKAVKAYIDGGGDVPVGTKIVPTGGILPYGGATAPSYFLLCDGSAVSRATYADLFGVISTTYGVGDGATTFNVPNLQGRFPLGYSASAPTKVFTFASRSSDTITVTGADNHAHNELQTGQAVFYATTGTVITGLSDDTTYYAIRVAYNQFKLATSVANANTGTSVTLSGDGPEHKRSPSHIPLARWGKTEERKQTQKYLRTTMICITTPRMNSMMERQDGRLQVPLEERRPVHLRWEAQHQTTCRSSRW